MIVKYVLFVHKYLKLVFFLLQLKEGTCGLLVLFMSNIRCISHILKASHFQRIWHCGQLMVLNGWDMAVIHCFGLWGVRCALWGYFAVGARIIRYRFPQVKIPLFLLNFEGIKFSKNVTFCGRPLQNAWKISDKYYLNCLRDVSRRSRATMLRFMHLKYLWES